MPDERCGGRSRHISHLAFVLANPLALRDSPRDYYVLVCTGRSRTPRKFWDFTDDDAVTHCLE
jgi:hypothetical protein